jgi:hypothetical protein
MKNAQLTALEATLSAVAGCDVEITIRAEKQFTVSAEGNQTSAFEKVVAYFGKLATFQPFEYDAEIDFTCAYFAVNS